MRYNHTILYENWLAFFCVFRFSLVFVNILHVCMYQHLEVYCRYWIWHFERAREKLINRKNTWRTVSKRKNKTKTKNQNENNIVTFDQKKRTELNTQSNHDLLVFFLSVSRCHLYCLGIHKAQSIIIFPWFASQLIEQTWQKTRIKRNLKAAGALN